MTPFNITANGGTQVGATPVPSNAALTVVLVTTTANNTAVVLPSTAEIGRGIEIYVTGPTSAFIFPATGQSIGDNGTDVNVGVGPTVTGSSGGRLFRRMTSTKWQVTFG